MAETIYNGFTICMLVVLAVVVFGYFIRTILGPHFADRMVAVNSISTVVMLFISFIAVMQGNGAFRARKEGIAEFLAKKLQRSIGFNIFADGIHIDADGLPFIVITHGGIACALCAGTGNLIAAGFTVANIAGLAVRADTAAGIFEHFIEIHINKPPYTGKNLLT